MLGYGSNKKCALGRAIMHDSHHRLAYRYESAGEPIGFEDLQAGLTGFFVVHLARILVQYRTQLSYFVNHVPLSPS